MGFSDAFKSFFGGSDKTALKQTKKDNAARQGFVEDQMAQSRADLMNYLPMAQQNANMGFSAGLDVMGQYMPQQFDAFQQGNVGAQEQLIAGMPQVHNAILGMPVDYSAFQPMSIDYDTSYTQQQLPDFVQLGSPLAGNAAPQTPQGGGSGFRSGGFAPGSYGFDPTIWGIQNNVVPR